MITYEAVMKGRVRFLGLVREGKPSAESFPAIDERKTTLELKPYGGVNAFKTQRGWNHGVKSVPLRLMTRRDGLFLF
jgi:hypothetical protein